MKLLKMLAVPILAAILFMVGCNGGAEKTTEPPLSPADTTPCSKSYDNAIPFDDAVVFIEFNSTDEDVGFQATFDASGWKWAAICGPDGSKLFDVKAGGSTEKHGLSEMFFEGAEPPLTEQTLDEFFTRFPEGEYTIVGETIDGDALMSTATFTHDIPDAPVMISPEEDELVDPDDTVIAWEPVTGPSGIEIVGYELFVALVPVEMESPTVNFELILELPSTVTEVQILPGMLMPGNKYEFEVLSIEKSGNKTITAGEFVTAGQKTQPKEPDESEPKITEEEAKAIALAKVPGRVTDIDLEKKFGKITWVVEIDADDGPETDVIIDIQTGEVLGIET